MSATVTGCVLSIRSSSGHVLAATTRSLRPITNSTCRSRFGGRRAISKMGGSLRWADHNAQKTCGIVVQRYQFNASDKKTALRARKWIPQLGTDLILLGLTQ